MVYGKYNVWIAITCMFVYMSARLFVHTCKLMCVCVCVCKCACVHTCMRACALAHSCVRTSICVHNNNNTKGIITVLLKVSLNSFIDHAVI